MHLGIIRFNFYFYFLFLFLFLFFLLLRKGLEDLLVGGESLGRFSINECIGCLNSYMCDYSLLTVYIVC